MLTSPTRVPLDRQEGACFSRWLSRWMFSPVSSLTACDIANYLKSREQDGASQRDIAREERLLRSFFRWAHRRGICPADPTSKIDGPDAPESVLVFWSEEEERRLLDVCRGEFPPGAQVLDAIRRPVMPPPYMHALVLVCLRTGLRINHLLALEWGQVDLARGTLTVPAQQTLNRRDIVVRLDDDSKQAIASILRKAKDSVVLPRRVFEAAGLPLWNGRPDELTVSNALSRLERVAQLPEGGFDALRLTHARRAASGGVPLAKSIEAGDWEDGTAVQRVYASVEARREPKSSSS